MNNIQPLLKRVRKIDKAIAWYQARREMVLREDAEYDAYLDRYEYFYPGDEPLSIHYYYQYKEMLDALYGCEEPTSQETSAIAKLERRLAI